MMSNKKLSKEIVNERISGREVEMIGEYVSKDVKTLFRCVDGHTWLASPNNVMRNKGRCCPHCAVGQIPLTAEIINERLIKSGNGYVLMGEFVKTSTKAMFGCAKNHTWMAKPNNILSGRGCPHCASSGGYKAEKPGWMYVIEYTNYIKYGITNNPKVRLSKHNRWGDYKTLLLRRFEDGHRPRTWEQEIRRLYGGSFVTKEIMADGWTETLSLVLSKQIISFTNDKYNTEE